MRNRNCAVHRRILSVDSLSEALLHNEYIHGDVMEIHLFFPSLPAKNLIFQFSLHLIKSLILRDNDKIIQILNESPNNIFFLKKRLIYF